VLVGVVRGVGVGACGVLCGGTGMRCVAGCVAGGVEHSVVGCLVAHSGSHVLGWDGFPHEHRGLWAATFGLITRHTAS
jgi:hypothetical protein